MTRGYEDEHHEMMREYKIVLYGKMVKSKQDLAARDRARVKGKLGLDTEGPNAMVKDKRGLGSEGPKAMVKVKQGLAPRDSSAMVKGK